MSKLETVRALNDSAPQLEIVRSVRELRQQLEQLPTAVANEIAEPLEKLGRMAEAVDQMAAAQRQTFEQLLAMSRRDQAKMQEAATEASGAASSLTKAAQRLQAAQPKAWKQLASMAGAALLAGAMVVAGMTALSRLQQPAAEPLDARTQQRAAAMDALLQRATPEEREQLRQILRRQSPPTPPAG